MIPVNFNINPNDLKNVLKTVLVRILAREENCRQQIMNTLDEDINEERCDEILIKLQNIMKVMGTSATELSELSTLVELIRASNAEVLENLPDLEEDSLGVDLGSVQPRAIPANTE